MKKIILLFLIIILLIIAIQLKPKSILNYDRSKKTIKKEELTIYDKKNNCQLNNEVRSQNNDDYSKIFNKEKIQDVEITIPEKNLFYLFENAIEKPQVFFNSIKIGNYKINCASIKPKGYTTLRYLWNTNNNKFSFTINFKKYLKKQNLFGLNKISFNNMYTDKTLSKEMISYYLFEEMGLDTVKYSYINLTINQEYFGNYFMIEPIDEALIKRTMNEEGDFLFKPDGKEATLLYDDKLDEYIGDDAEYRFDSLIYDNNGNYRYPKSSNNILNQYKGIWEDDEDDFKKIYNQLPTFFKTIKKLNKLSNLEDKNTKEYEKELESIIDVDKLIKYIAINTYLVNTDGYSNEPPRNYALYMNEEGFITIIPWDYNMILGTTNIHNINDVINFDIYHPTVGCNLKDRPLWNVILGNEHYKKKYEEYLKDITKIATEGGITSSKKKYPKHNLEKIINQYSRELIKNNKSNQKFYTNEEIEQAQKNLKEVLKLRSKSVINQLNKNNDKIYSNIEINSLGELK